MKAIILNAGRGSRLGRDIPKGLVEIADKLNILDLQLRALQKNLDLKYEDILVVIGYKKELFKDKYPFLSFAINNNFTNTSTAKSLLMGLKEIEADDVLWINGDVVFDDPTAELLKENLDKNLILVNGDLSTIKDEEYKISVDKDGFINRISKSLQNACGYHIGINYIKKENFDILKHYLEKGGDSDYFDRALQSTITKGAKFLPLDIQNYFCIEIDYEEELDLAKKFISSNLL